jgi:hypothetical protein
VATGYPCMRGKSFAFVFNQGIMADSDFKVVAINCIRGSGFAL